MIASIALVTVLAVSSWQFLGPLISPVTPTWEERFDDPTLGVWEQVHRATPSRLALVETPSRGAGRAARFSVADGDVAPLTPTENPRAQLNSELTFSEGDDVYVGWSTYLPRGFPEDIAPWFVFFQFHGKPYEGSPRIALGVKDGRIGLERDELYRYDRPWTTPIRTGRWMDYVLHVKWSKNPRVGFVELWLNGDRQKFVNGSQRLMMATIKRSQSEVQLIPTNYRMRGAIRGTVTIFHDDIAVGESFRAVDR